MERTMQYITEALDREKKLERERSFLLHQLMDLGELLLSCGAEVSRVEDTLERMGRAYGARRMNVFVITSSIVITMVFSDGEETTQTRQIHPGSGINFAVFEELNSLSRSYCESPCSVRELERRIEEISDKERENLSGFFGAMLGAGSCAVFFGGSLKDATIAAAFGLVIVVVQRKTQEIVPNTVVFNLIASFLLGIAAVLAGRLLPFLNADHIMIGDIMLLIPGLAMTNAVRDIFVGDTISGVMRLVECFLWAGAIACGVMAAIVLMGGLYV